MLEDGVPDPVEGCWCRSRPSGYLRPLVGDLSPLLDRSAKTPKAAWGRRLRFTSTVTDEEHVVLCTPDGAVAYEPLSWPVPDDDALPTAAQPHPASPGG